MSATEWIGRLHGSDSRPRDAFVDGWRVRARAAIVDSPDTTDTSLRRARRPVRVPLRSVVLARECRHACRVVGACAAMPNSLARARVPDARLKNLHWPRKEPRQPARDGIRRRRPGRLEQGLPRPPRHVGENDDQEVSCQVGACVLRVRIGAQRQPQRGRASVLQQLRSGRSGFALLDNLLARLLMR